MKSEDASHVYKVLILSDPGDSNLGEFPDGKEHINHL